MPYIFTAVVWVAPVHNYFFGSEDLVEKYVLGSSPSQLWFLLMLFWVFAIFWPLSRLANEKPFIGALISCIIFCIGFIAPTYYCINTGLQYVLFFYAGFMIRKMNLGNKFLYKIPSIIYILADAFLFIVVQFCGNHEGIIFKLSFVVISLALHLFGAVAAFVLLQKLVYKIGRQNRAVSFFAKHSMAVYLVHQQIIYFSTGWVNGLVLPIVMVLSNFIVAMVGATVFAVLMSKTKVTRFLIGSK